jgi:UDP:flavonoid glycosyltransferase YjiC (YdhE family)
VRLLFTTAPMRGHLYPLVPLAWAARAAGHEVLVATTEQFVAVVAQSGLPGVACGQTPDFVELVAGVSGDPAARRHAHGTAFARIAGMCLSGTRSLAASFRPDVVVSERAEFAGPVAAGERGVPWVEYQWGVAELPEYQWAAAELADRPAPAEVLNPWPPGLRLPHARTHQGLRNIAYNGGDPLPGWVFEDRSRPRVCVTFGTVAPRLGVPGLNDMLERLARLHVELLVAADEETLRAYPQLSTVADRVGRLPLAQVLPTCDAVINHGGQGTVLTALVAACPQLVVPQVDDQFDNATAVAGAGAGRYLLPDEATPVAVAEQCQALLDDRGPARAAARVADEIAAQPSPAEIVDLLEKIVCSVP